MIRLFVQTTHMKIEYSEASRQEMMLSERLIKETFSAEDETLQRSNLVKRGLASAVRSLYIDDKNLLLTGLLPFLKALYDKNNLKYTIIDGRKWFKPDIEYLKKLKAGKISYISKTGENEGVEFIPRSYQRDAVLSLFGALNKKSGQSCGLLQLSTGAGKTFVQALLMHALNKQKILCVYKDVELLHDGYKSFVNDFGFDENEIGIVQGQHVDLDKRITLLSVASFEKACVIFPDIRCLVFDEGHALGSGFGDEMATRILYSCQNATMRIGLSATCDKIDNPFRQLSLYGNFGPIVYNNTIRDNINNDKLVDGTIFMHRVQGHIPVTGNWADVYTYYKIPLEKIYKKYEKDDNFAFGDVVWADDILRVYNFHDYVHNKHYVKTVQNLLLENKEHLILKTNIDKSVELAQILKENITSHHIHVHDSRFVILLDDKHSIVKEKGETLIRKFIQYGDESTHFVYNTARNERIAELAAHENHVLVLFVRTQHGIEICRQLEKIGFTNYQMIHGKDDQDTRNEAKQFLKEKTNVVLASKIWNKGIDIPWIHTVIIAGAGKDTVNTIQRLGRGVRKDAKSGKTEMRLHDFMDEFSPIGKRQSNKRSKIYSDDLGFKVVNVE